LPSKLAGLAPLELPTAGHAAHPSHRGARWNACCLRVDAQLKALSRNEGVTLFMTLLAGFQVLLRAMRSRRHKRWEPT